MTVSPMPESAKRAAMESLRQAALTRYPGATVEVVTRDELERRELERRDRDAAPGGGCA